MKGQRRVVFGAGTAIALFLTGCTGGAERVVPTSGAHATRASTPVTPGPTLRSPIPPTIPLGGLPPGRREIGITGDKQAPFGNSVFGVTNQYSGPYLDQWVNIYAGGQRSPDGSFVRGGIRVYLGPVDTQSGGPHFVGQFDPPNAPTWVKLVAADGSLVTLQREDGSQVSFHLDTDSFS